MKKEQDKWTNTLKVIKPDLKKGDYRVALESVDEFLTKSEFPQVRLSALMMKAKCCFGAWQDKRKCETKYY